MLSLGLANGGSRASLRSSLMGSRESIPASASVPTTVAHGTLPAVSTRLLDSVPPGHAGCTTPRDDDGGAGRSGAEGEEEDNARDADPTATAVDSALLPFGHAGAESCSVATTRPFRCPSLPRMVIVLLVASSLVQGFSASVIGIFINRELAMQPVEVTRYWMFIGFTMWTQPLLGYISDAFVVCGEKRRPLFIVAALGNALLYATYGLVPSATSNFTRFVVLSVVSQFCTMGLYIPLNGLVVEVGRHDAETEAESNARMSAIMAKTMVWRSSGSLAGAVLHTCLIALLEVGPMLGITGVLFAALAPAVLCTPSHLFLRTSSRDDNFYKRVGKAARLLWRSFQQRDLHGDGVCFVLVLAFVFVYTMMPDAGSVYYSYLYTAFTFPNWFYSLNGCVGHIGSITGAYVFSRWMDRRAGQEARGGTRTSLFFIFMIGSVAWAVGYVTNLLLCTGFVTEALGVSAAFYVPVDTFFTSLFARFAFMPTLAMAAEHAPAYFEATTFEVFSVASIGGGTVSAMLTADIATRLHITRSDYSQLWVLLLISIGSKLAPIALAYVLPERRRTSGATEEVVISDGDGPLASPPRRTMPTQRESSRALDEGDLPSGGPHPKHTGGKVGP